MTGGPDARRTADRESGNPWPTTEIDNHRVLLKPKQGAHGVWRKIGNELPAELGVGVFCASWAGRWASRPAGCTAARGYDRVMPWPYAVS